MDSCALLQGIGGAVDIRRLDPGQLVRLAGEVRHDMIRVVSETGGHLGAGLGVVELAVALHHVFRTPEDRLIWDVGHQSYPHKLLTGRRERLSTLRQGGGLSGFTRREESPFDPFGAGHSSTSISAGLGMAVARDLNRGDTHVVCVIGDGALSAGMAYEALNNAGALGARLIVVLNDNGMSIAPAVGAMSGYLKRLSQGDEPGRTLFEHLGFAYFGPVDGHDLARLVPALELARDSGGQRPVLVHVRTEKGHGYAPAAEQAERCHGMGRFDVATGREKTKPSAAPSYTAVFALALAAAAESDPKIAAVTAAMPSGTGLDVFAARYPDRCFDVGIAEQHAVTFAAGLACEGMRPFVAVYSTFLQRAYDQVIHDVALQCLPVRFALDRAGLVGPDGATHHGAFDLAYLCCLPNMVVMAPADEAELVHMVATAAAIDDRPSAIRYPRGAGTGVELPHHGVPLPVGRGRILRDGATVALLGLGAAVGACVAAAQRLTAMGVSTTVADARFAKPLDEDLIGDLAQRHAVLVTVEEGAVGGFGSWVLFSLAQRGLLDRGLKVRQMALPDRFIEHDTVEAQRRAAGLTAADIVATVCAALGTTVVESVVRS